MITEPVDIVEVYTDDYCAIYLNGIKSQEGHSVHVGALLESLKGKVIISYSTFYVEAYIIDYEYNWEFPEELSKFEKGHLV